MGHGLQKLHGNFKGFLFLTAELAISIKYPVLNLRAILKGRFVGGNGRQKPHPIGFHHRLEGGDSESPNESCLLTMFIDSN